MCRDYLLGLCPHALLQNTKEDLGFCPGVHDDKLKYAYRAAARAPGGSAATAAYERAHERTLDNFVVNAERKIGRSKRRADDGSAVASIDVDRLPELAEISKQVDDKLGEAEAAGEAGEADRALGAMAEVELLRRKKAEMQARLVRSQPGGGGGGGEGGAGSSRQRMRVCEICGAFMSLNDSDDRLADHFGGRVHLGFLAIRQKLEALRARLGGGGGSGGGLDTGAGSAANNAPLGEAGGSRISYGGAGGRGAPLAAGPRPLPAAASGAISSAPPPPSAAGDAPSGAYGGARGPVGASGGGGGGGGGSGGLDHHDRAADRSRGTGYDDRGRGSGGYEDRGRGGGGYDDRGRGGGGYDDRGRGGGGYDDRGRGGDPRDDRGRGGGGYDDRGRGGYGDPRDDRGARRGRSRSRE